MSRIGPDICQILLLENVTPFIEQYVIRKTKVKVSNVSEAFRKIIYITRIFYKNKLSQSFKIYKLKSAS